MKWRSITIVFPKPLTEAQEYQLIADIKAVIESVRKGIAKYREKMDSHIEFKAIALTPGGAGGIALLKGKLMELEAKTYSYFTFDRLDNDACVYVFAHAYEELSVLNQKVKLPGMGRFQLTKGDIFQEEKLMRTLRDITIRSIGYQPHEVSIVRGEFEKAV
jgi:hypothetical protein